MMRPMPSWKDGLMVTKDDLNDALSPHITASPTHGWEIAEADLRSVVTVGRSTPDVLVLDGKVVYVRRADGSITPFVPLDTEE